MAKWKCEKCGSEKEVEMGEQCCGMAMKKC